MAFPVFEKKEDIPKGFEEDYEEREGKFHPKVPDVANLKSALETEKIEREKEKQARIKAENAATELRREKAKADGTITDDQLNKLREEDAAKRKEEVDPVKRELDETKAKLRKITLNDRLRSLGAAAGWLSDRADDALDAALKRVDLAKDSDTNIVVKDQKGELTTETVDHFLKVTFKKEKPWLYAGSGASGSGASGSTASADDEPPAPTEKKQLDEKRALVATVL